MHNIKEVLKSMDSMAENRIMKEAIKERGKTQAVLAGALGLSQNALSNNLNRVRTSVQVFKEVLDALDYDVVIVDRHSGEQKWRLDV